MENEEWKNLSELVTQQRIPFRLLPRPNRYDTTPEHDEKKILVCSAIRGHVQIEQSSCLIMEKNSCLIMEFLCCFKHNFRLASTVLHEYTHSGM